jgi:hypothetical protein
MRPRVHHFVLQGHSHWPLYLSWCIQLTSPQTISLISF